MLRAGCAPSALPGGVLVVPRGLRGESAAPAQIPRDTQESAARARAIVMETERALGFEPTDRETDFGAASVNYSFKDLLARAGPPC